MNKTPITSINKGYRVYLLIFFNFHSKEKFDSKDDSKFFTSIFDTKKGDKMGKWIKSTMYKGVYHRKSKNGEITYYFTYQDENRKTTYKKVGTKSSGVDEKYTHEQRMKTIMFIRTGDLPPKLLRNSPKYKVTVNDMAEFYFKYHITKSSPKRLRQYNYRLKSFFGDMEIHSVTTDDVERFKRKTILEVTKQTALLYLELLSTIFNYYKRKQQIKLINPVMLVSKPRIDNRRERILSLEEIELLFNEISHDYTMTLFLSLSLCTAARKSTVLNYKIKDVDLNHKMINSYDFKNNTSYKSFLDDRTIDLIKTRLSQTNDINEPLVYQPDVGDMQRWISRMFKNVLDHLFNQGLSPSDYKNRCVIHNIRHTVLSHLAMQGHSEYILKRISNHKSSQMVERYVKLNSESGRNEIEKLWATTPKKSANFTIEN